MSFNAVPIEGGTRGQRWRLEFEMDLAPGFTPTSHLLILEGQSIETNDMLHVYEAENFFLALGLAEWFKCRALQVLTETSE